MEFLIADTFTNSLARLDGRGAESSKDYGLRPTDQSGESRHGFHRLDRAKDKNFWSVRVSRDIRLIIHKTQTSLLLCYVGHHDAAYDWAERRKLETHPKTGAAQFVEIRERVQEIVVPSYVEGPQPVAEKEKIFAGLSDETLLSYGVPKEWLHDVRDSDEDTFAELVLSIYPLKPQKRSLNSPLVENRNQEPSNT